MRFKIDISINKDEISKDKNRLILSLIKTVIRNYDKEYFNEMYMNNRTKRKNMTFSVYMKDAKFLRDTIVIPSKRISLFISSSDLELSLVLYNSFLNMMNTEIELKEKLFVKIEDITLMKKEIINSSSVFVKTVSPICIRDHIDNKNTWYYCFDDEKGKAIFMRNLKLQLVEEFGKENIADINKLKIDVIQTKTVKVKHYTVVIPSNLAFLKITGKHYLIEYLLDAGLGSLKSSGFGMLKKL